MTKQKSKEQVETVETDSVPKKYRVSIFKNNNYDMDEMKKWIALNSTGKSYYRHYKKTTVFYFYDIDDAFKFKMRWETA